MVYTTLVWLDRMRAAGRLSWLLLAAAVYLLGAEGVAQGDVVELTRAGWGQVTAAFLTSAGLLGSVMLAMLLGHSYLTSPGLPVSHLHRLTTIVALFLLGRLVVCLGGVDALLFRAGGFAWSDPVFWLSSTVPVFLFRLGIGIVVPAIMAIRIDRFVRVRSTQKATGLLYVALVFVLFGELLASYLLVLTAVPT